MSSSVQSVSSSGNSGIIIDIECHLSNNLPIIVIVGFANRAVGEAKERIRGAFADSRIILDRKRITVNLAPADVPKADSGFDLAIAAAIMVASGQIPVDQLGKDAAIIGELGLDGSVRAVRGVIGKIMAGRSLGISKFFIPKANLAQAQLIPEVQLWPVENLLEFYHHCHGESTIERISTGDGRYENTGSTPASMSHNNVSLQLSDVVGQIQAKRALAISAAGGHNVLFSGPPGTGKSMLAKTLASILPPLSREEILEVTQLHSLASNNYQEIILQRPFRAPHHTASHVAIVGGGANQIRPGEISLAHRGVLLFDEFPEFDHATIEALRQPLEDRLVSIARSKEVVEFPANFILVATANPCPCGYNGHPTKSNKCHCSMIAISQYNHRLSGPIMDRIDLYTDVHEVEHAHLLNETAQNIIESGYKSDAEIRDQVHYARRLQAARYGDARKLNADMSNAEIRRHARLQIAARNRLDEAATSMDLSARGYMRTIKVARTIADLEGCDTISEDHILEAVRYRRVQHAT